MEITKLLTKDNLWMDFAPDLNIRTSLGNFGFEGQFHVDACIWYDMEKSDWVYEFESPGIIAMLGLKEQKDTIIAFLKAASIKQREDISVLRLRDRTCCTVHTVPIRPFPERSSRKRGHRAGNPAQILRETGTGHRDNRQIHSPLPQD